MVELLVALTVTVLVSAAVMSLAFSAQAVFETDKHRTTVNQNLRSGIDLVGLDVRQAGERLPGDVPAVEIIDGENDGPDRLILRRNEFDVVLPVCNLIIKAGSATDALFCSRRDVTHKYPPGCAPAADSNSDGWPDNLEAWRDYRINNGGVITAYLHNTATDEGEFFRYDAEDNSTMHIHKLNDEAWQYTYELTDSPRMYILEQKEFYVENGVLKSIVNGDTDNPLNLVSHITDFQCRAVFRDGTIQTSMGLSDDWSDLAAVEIWLSAESEWKDRAIDNTLVTRFFPRNVMSSYAGIDFTSDEPLPNGGLPRGEPCDDDYDCFSEWCHHGVCK
jgi:hypothetical protein